MYKIAAILSVLLLCCDVCRAETLTFVAQFDPSLSATNYSWFSPDNWFVGDVESNLIPAGRVPLANETAIISGTVDAGQSGIRVQMLVLTDDAVARHGTFSIERLQMLSRSTFDASAVNLVSSMAVNGTNCVLSASKVNLLGVAAATVIPLAPATSADLILRDGSVVEANGLLALADGTSLRSEGAPQSRIFLTGTLASSGNAVVTGAETNQLIMDNSGIIRVDEGTLTFAGGIEWESTASLGQFQVAKTNALVIFASPLQVPTGVTSAFSGPGWSQVQAGGSVDGTLRIGSGDSGAGFVPGQLECEGTLAGTGGIEVLGALSGGSILRWNKGTLSLPRVSVNAGGELFIGGGAGSSCHLVGCDVGNSGWCMLLAPELVLEGGAKVRTLSGATFEVATDGAIKGARLPTGGEISNAGTFLKTSTGITEFGGINPAEGPDFNSTGLVDIRAGELKLFGGVSTGEFHTGRGTLLSFWGGTYVLGKNSSFTGEGIIGVAQGAAPARWVAAEGLAVGNLQLGSNGTVVGGGMTTNVISIGILLASENATLQEGIFEINEFAVEGAILTNATVNVGSSLEVRSSDFSLHRTTLKIRKSAAARLDAVSPATAASVNLSENSALLVEGKLNLIGNSAISGMGLSTNKLAIFPGAELTSTNSGQIQGSGTAPLAIDNGGVIRVLGGSLTFAGALEFQSSGGVSAFETAAPDAMLLFASPHHVRPWNTHVFTGAGTARLAAGGEIEGRIQLGLVNNLPPGFKGGFLEVSNSVVGTGTLDVLGNGAQGSVLSWRNGQLAMARLNIDAGARLLVTNEEAKRDLSGCTINNGGLCVWPGRMITAGAGAVFNVLPTGILDLQNDATLAYNQTAPRLRLGNSGTLTKSTGTAVAVLDADVSNSGTLRLNAGNLEVKGALVQTAGQTVLQGGTVLAGAVFQLNGGTLTGSGKLSATLNNAGAVLPGSGIGILTVGNAKDYQQFAAGVLRIELAGATPGILNDKLVVNGTAGLSGRLEIQLANGFVPQKGEVFEVLAAAAVTGKFEGVVGDHPPATAWVPRYTGTNVAVTLASQVNIGEPAISNGQFSFPFSTSPGVDYHVQACSDLNVADWQDVQTVAGDGEVKFLKESFGSGNRFFRILVE